MFNFKGKTSFAAINPYSAIGFMLQRNSLHNTSQKLATGSFATAYRLSASGPPDAFIPPAMSRKFANKRLHGTPRL